MGQVEEWGEVVKTVLTESDMELVAGINRSSGPIDLGKMVGLEECGVKMSNDLELALTESKPDVLVDFTDRKQRFRIQVWRFG